VVGSRAPEIADATQAERVDASMTPSATTVPAWRFRAAWCAIFAGGVVLRLALFSGYGLADDANYWNAYHGIYEIGGWNWSEHVPYDFRFAFWIPVVGFMNLFGVTEWSWVGFVTLCSIVNLPLTYALARQEWRRESALCAMALLAAFPLDVVTSTLFAVDIPLTTYCYGAFWLYREACRRPAHSGMRVAAALAAAVLLFLGYSAKQWGLLIGALFAIEAVRRGREALVPTAVCAGAFGTFMAAYAGWQWRSFGDPLYDVHLVGTVAAFEPHTWANQLDYYQMLFLPNAYGTFFAGWYPHALVVLAVAFAHRIRTAGTWLLYFVVAMVGLSSMPAHYENGHWVILVTHIFRYLCWISIPLCLALTGYLRELERWRHSAGAALAVALIACAVVQSVALSWPTRDAFGEQRRANALILSTFPDDVVWADIGFFGRLMSFAPDRRGLGRIREVRSETAAAQARDFAKIDEGVVVTGGGRLPWYGCPTCALSAGAFTPPPTWTLVTMYGAAELGLQRREPMRIWRVSPAVARANELLADRVDDPERLALLNELVEHEDHAVAAEVGRRLVEQRMQAEGSIAYLTGLASMRIGKPAAARRYWDRAVDGVIAPGEARALIHATIVSGTFEDREVVPGWIDRFQRRFPGEALDPSMAAARPVLADVEPLLRASRYADAATRLLQIRDREGDASERRRNAQYLAALALFRAEAVDAAVREAESYRARYGDDDWALELHYREGEARVARAPRAARDAFADVVARAPGSLWAAEARKRLATLDATAAR
jgi:hypothetical protein